MVFGNGPGGGVDESGLREIAEAFYVRLLAAWQALPAPRPTLRERDFWAQHFLDLAREVSRAAHETDVRALRRIHQIASQQHGLLSPTDKLMGAGRVLQDVADTASAAVRATGTDAK
jgi:hypothetical protein